MHASDHPSSIKPSLSRSAREYTSSDWERFQASIRRWYIAENRPLHEVKAKLEEHDFYVTERMIRTRLKKWGYDCKNQRFVHGRAKARETTTSPASTGSSTTTASNETKRSRGRDRPSGRRTRLASAPQPLIQQVSIAEQQYYDQALKWTKTYCQVYVSDRDAATKHPEPRIHRDTLHAIFGERMADGLFLLKRRKVVSAFKHINTAFEYLDPLLRDHHPMSTAQILITLMQTQGEPGLSALSKAHLAEFSSTLQSPPHPLTPLYQALNACDDASRTDLILRTLRCLRDELTDGLGAWDWKSLYAANAVCDALYYSQSVPSTLPAGTTIKTEQSPPPTDPVASSSTAPIPSPRVPSFSSRRDDNASERRTARRALLTAQKHVYGRSARNVLWTATNVADDDLSAGDLDRSEKGYQEVLELAEESGEDGYGLAKTRFAALEGLGCVFAVRADQSSAGSRDEDQDSDEAVDRQEEVKRWRRVAYELFDEAERLGLVWFEAEGRRVSRVKEGKEAMASMLTGHDDSDSKKIASGT